MSISRTVRSILALACMGALPLYGQYSTQTTGTTSTTQKVTKRPVAKKTEAPPQTSTTGTAETKAPEKKAPEKKAAPKHRVAGGSRTRVWSDVTRLSAILIDTQNQKVNIPAEAWQKTANEAKALANRIALNAGGQKAARELRTHIHEMHRAAMSGDSNGARAHAAAALPYAYQLTDWAAPTM